MLVPNIEVAEAGKQIEYVIKLFYVESVEKYCRRSDYNFKINSRNRHVVTSNIHIELRFPLTLYDSFRIGRSFLHVPSDRRGDSFVRLHLVLPQTLCRLVPMPRRYSIIERKLRILRVLWSMFIPRHTL